MPKPRRVTYPPRLTRELYRIVMEGVPRSLLDMVGQTVRVGTYRAEAEPMAGYPIEGYRGTIREITRARHRRDALIIRLSTAHGTRFTSVRYVPALMTRLRREL